MAVISPNLCKWRCILCPHLGGIDPEKRDRATLTWFFRRVLTVRPFNFDALRGLVSGEG